MNRFVACILACSAGGAGFWIGGHSTLVSSYIETSAARLPGPVASAAPSRSASPTRAAYYRDPDGKPAYSATPRKTADGRDYVAVEDGSDVRFNGSGTIRPVLATSGPKPTLSRRIKFYRNPMGLPDTSPVPKKDNMGMDYLPVYEGGEDASGIVTISPGRLQTTGVRSEPAEFRRVIQTVRVPGTVQFDERMITVVSTRSDAFIDHVENITTGDAVRKGQPLVSVYSPEINSAAAQLVSNPGFEGSRRRLKNLNVSDEAIAEMERTRRVPDTIMWSAPHAGVVLERGAVEGMKAAAGATLFRIGDTSTMWVLADVPEHDIGGIQIGQAANVHVRALPNRTFSGRIGLIYPRVIDATRSTRVRIQLPNPGGVLLADMYADVEIVTGTPAPVVAVPDDAVIDTGTKQTVIIDRGGGRLEPRAVALGVRGDGFTEVRSGVKRGENVVTSANFLIDAESNLKAAFEGLSAANPAPGEGRSP